MNARRLLALCSANFFLTQAIFAASDNEPRFTITLNVLPPHISTDRSVKYDYDIVYVRGRRAGDEIHKRFYTDIASPIFLEPGADLMLLHPDGSEELLAEGGEGAVTDPIMSYDGEWIYYTFIYTVKGASQFVPPSKGADIFKLHLKSRKIVQLTKQEFTPNTGAADWSKDCRTEETGKTWLSYGVFNMGPCPLPGGRIVFTSNRNAFRPPRAYPRVALQLFVMDDDGNNVEQIGHLNIAGALHPFVLTDGRILFSSLESQGARSDILWGIWSINPDGTSWAPVVSAFDPGGAPNAFHFQSQLSDGSIIVEGYYNQNNSGFGTYIKLPLQPDANYPAFGPAYMRDPRNKPWRFGRFENGKGKWYRMPFMPAGAESITRFAIIEDGPAEPSVLGDKNSPKTGKFTHPSAAPDNHLLTIWSPGPSNHQYKYLPQIDGGIYLIKGGQPIDEPGRMLLIKNDPNYNEQWPRAVVPYQRIYGIDEPKRIPPLANDGKRSPELPEGTPFGFVGTSSLYKRESYPNGVVPEGKVTATFAGGNDPWRGLDQFTSHGNGIALNWHNQGADAGLYSNEDIHAVRILALEPTTDRNRGPKSGRLFHSHALERLRILGEIPVRKFDVSRQRRTANSPSPRPSPAGRGSVALRAGTDGSAPNSSKSGELSYLSFEESAGPTPRRSGSGHAGGLRGNPPTGSAKSVEFTQDGQPHDPDGNPDTSFLAKIPANTAFTFQTLDKHGMVLNMAQTWHQLRPGEIRNNCGGCHAHSQKPTPFELTAAAKPGYKVWDLVNNTPLLTSKSRDQSGQKWDANGETGLKTAKTAIQNVEYWRDVKPILQRSCVACHSSKLVAADVRRLTPESATRNLKSEINESLLTSAATNQPAGNLDLDADDQWVGVEDHGKLPGTYVRLAADERAKFGYKPPGWDSWGYLNASRYVRKFQSRRSLLVWKIYGRRLDGFSSDDHPSEITPGEGKLYFKGQLVDLAKNRHKLDIDYTGAIMPPPEAVAGTFVSPDGRNIKVETLSDEDKLTLVRWIDLGCPIDLDYDPQHPDARSFGWMCDDNRPVLTLTFPSAGANAELSRILVGMYDYNSGLDLESFEVTADFKVDGSAPGENLGKRFKLKSEGVWELKLAKPIARLGKSRLNVSIKDRQGNIARIERTFSVGPGGGTTRHALR